MNHDIDIPIPYGEKLVIKERNLEEMKKDVSEKFQGFIQDGEEGSVTVGFEDPERIREILTPKRRELMKAIIVEEPESITELAEITNRGISEVHRDLEILKENRIVFLEEKGEGLPKKASSTLQRYRDQIRPEEEFVGTRDRSRAGENLKS